MGRALFGEIFNPVSRPLVPRAHSPFKFGALRTSHIVLALPSLSLFYDAPPSPAPLNQAVATNCSDNVNNVIIIIIIVKTIINNNVAQIIINLVIILITKKQITLIIYTNTQDGGHRNHHTTTAKY